MSDKTFTPKKIIFVFSNDRLRGKLDSLAFYGPLMEAGHQIVKVFDSCDKAMDFVLENPDAADTLVATTHHDRAHVELFEVFDRMADPRDLGDRHTDSSRIVITIGPFSTFFSDSRYMSHMKTPDYLTYVNYDVDIFQRSPHRMQDANVNPEDYSPDSLADKLISTINLTPRGQHLITKREVLEQIVAEKDAKGTVEKRASNDTPELH